jgi:protocatechuate 3,4-dioxygenase beta subunit
MRHEALISFIILICISDGICFTSDVLAQSTGATVQPGVYHLPPDLTAGPVQGGHVIGYVFDADGNPIPGATVTLWQDGQLWNTTNIIWGFCTNPQTTNIYNEVTDGYLTEGAFNFGLLYPGEYSLTAEKYGYSGKSAIFRIGNETMRQTILDPMLPPTIMNITLNNYHVPTYTPEQLSYTGAIEGTIQGENGGGTELANVSLWQDGHLVNIPHNPQEELRHNFSGRSIDYTFEHIAPGHYTVMAEYSTIHLVGNIIGNDTVSVDVGMDTVMAEIVSQFAFPQPSWPPDEINSSVSPSKESTPTPALPWIVVILVIGFVACFLHDKHNR